MAAAKEISKDVAVTILFLFFVFFFIETGCCFWSACDKQGSASHLPSYALPFHTLPRGSFTDTWDRFKKNFPFWNARLN